MNLSANIRQNRKFLILTCLFLTFHVNAYSQSTERIQKRFRDTRQISEIYSVLKDDNRIKHGKYVKYFRLSYSDNKTYRREFIKRLFNRGTIEINDYLMESGYYNFGKKDSTWITFYSPGVLISKIVYKNGIKNGIFEEYDNDGRIKQRGNYRMDIKNGIWEYFDPPGKLIAKGLYENDSRTGVWKYVKYHRNYLTAIDTYYDYDNEKHLAPEISLYEYYYPTAARELDIDGQVVFTFTLQPDCTLTDIRIISSPAEELSESVLHTIKHIGQAFKIHEIDCSAMEKPKVIEKTVRFRLH